MDTVDEIMITFVLPMYNVEKYLDRCLCSIFDQNLNCSEFEVIIIDDKGADNSIDIALDWKSKHSNITIIDHKINKGLGAARNTGLRNARGKFVWFIDSDDYIRTNCTKTLIADLQENKLDVITFNFYTQNYSGNFIEDNANAKHRTDVLNGKDFIEKYYQPSVMSSCSKIYRTKYLLSHTFFFPEGVFWEDADLVTRILFSAERVRFVPSHNYYYCLNQFSISRTNHWKKTADMVKMGYRKYNFAQSISNNNPAISKKIKNDGLWNATVIKKIVFNSHTERKLFYKEIEGEVRHLFAINMNNSIYRFMFKYPLLCQIFLFLIAPILKLIKSLR